MLFSGFSQTSVAKKTRQRNRVIMEIVETERSYIEALDLLVDVSLLHPLRRITTICTPVH